MLYQEMKKQQNIESVVNGAKDILAENEEIASDEVSEDWIIRFFNSIEDVSSEKMQSLWSKILAGEIKRPNSFSLRSLDAMTKMSQEEAKLFEEMSAYIINYSGNKAILNDENINEKYSINYKKILALDECGIFDSSALMHLSFKVRDGKDFLMINGMEMIKGTAKSEIEERRCS